MLGVFQVGAVLLPTNITAELSCNSRVYKYKDLKGCDFFAVFCFLLSNVKQYRICFYVCVFLDLT